MPVEVGIKVTLTVKKESGESESKTIPVKDFNSPHEPGTPEFWDDVLGYVRLYHIYPDKSQKTLFDTGSPEIKEKADVANKTLAKQLKKEKAKKDEPAEPAEPGT